MAKNIKGIKRIKDEVKELNKEYDSSKEKIKRFYYYSDEKNNFYNSEEKILLENDELKKEAKIVKEERKNQRIVSKYFKELSKSEIKKCS